MKKLLIGIAALIVATPLVAGASPSQTPEKKASTKSDARPAFKPETSVRESSDIIGTKVKDAQGKTIGEIDRLLIDAQSGRVTHAVVGLGGVMGVGEQKVVVPWSELKMGAATGGRKAEITMDQAKLQSAPRYERERMASERSPAASPATDSEKKK